MVQLPRICLNPPFLVLDFLVVSEKWVIAASLPSLPLLTAAGEPVSVY